MTNGAGCRIEGEQRRLIIDAAENGMLVVDRNGTIELANAAAECLLGYAPGTLLGLAASVLECAEIKSAVKSLGDPAAYVDPLVTLASGQSPTARRADGDRIPIGVVSRTLRTCAGAHLLFSISPLDRRRPLGIAAAPTNAAVPAGEYESAVLRGGRWRLDLATRTLSWSDEIFRIYGLDPSIVLTVDIAVAGYDPADRERVSGLVKRVMSDGTPYRDEARIVRPDGSIRSVVHGGAAERSADGTLVALCGYFQDVTESKNADRERERLSEYVMLANRSGKIGIWELDLRTNVSVWDPNMYALYGIADTTMVPTYELWTASLHPHDRARAMRQVKTDIAGGAPSDTEFRVIWESGEIHNIRSLVTVVCDATGTPTRIIGTDWDVTEIHTLGERLREEQEALMSSEARYRALTEAMPQMVWVIDAEDAFHYVNQRWVDYTGLTLDASRATGPAGVLDGADAASMTARRDATAREFESEIRLRRADGIYRWHLVRSVSFGDAPADAAKWIVTATDIEERKAAEKTLAATVAELEHIAHHDPMTNLPNRMLLMDRLSQAMAQANRVHGGVIVLYVDLDRFKAINDSLGHAAGDEVLKATGLRILSTLRAGDTASRVGGDEFVVVCAATRPADDGALIANRILTAIAQPIDVGNERVAVDASVGISVYPIDGFDADTLIRKADAAMYAAKENGSNTFRRYSNEFHASVVVAAEFEAELRHAIAAGELTVHFQPIIDLRTGRPRAAEALVRWHHPKRGMIPPVEFIGFAEERGLIAQIGEVVIESACAMLGRLRHCTRDDLGIGVNVSAHEFGRSGFIAGIVGALDRHHLEPSRLTIEITESVMMGNTRATTATLDELRRLGVKLSIDDFGTGYSSLAYIKKFPVTTLKIDRSFVRDIAHDLTDQAIAKTIITLAHSLGMCVVAEGVETQAQLAQIKAFGVDSVQGYFYSPPLPAAEFERYIASFRARDLRDGTILEFAEFGEDIA